MKMKFYTLMFLTVFLNVNLRVTQTAAQTIKPRLNQGALLEPQGKIINGAGQDKTAFMNYWNVQHTQNKPLVFMSYVSLKDITSDWADELKTSLMANTGKFLIPQIGLSMTVDGTPSAHYEQDVATGLYDDQIKMFIDGLQSLAIPAYVRIGYEFNGTTWNGYVPATYKNAFVRITNMIRTRGIEVATVWNLAMDGVMNFQDYYPGDSFVDWWAINCFSASHFTDSNAGRFLDSARVHKKPVMIGETTPRNVGVLNGQQSWDQWFAPFFTFMYNHPEVKAFSYINWNWSQYPQWQTWGDARLEQNAVVGNKFANELDSLKYQHATSERLFRKSFGLSDNSAPATPGNITLVPGDYPLQLTWNAVTDPSGLSHYIVYKRGVLSDYTLTLPYSDKNIMAGDTITYAVSAMDRAGNESQLTAGQRITVPLTLSKALNGEFDNGTKNWNLSTYDSGASATMKIDTNKVISGRNSCAIDITKITGTGWHIQLWQWLAIHPGRQYKITFKARASSAKVINLVVQQGASPYTMYLDKPHSLTTTVQTFTDNYTASVEDLAKLEFFLGTTGTVQVWIDLVSISEIFTVAPTVSTDSTTNITTNSAKAWGNVSSDGGSTVTERGIVYSTTANPTIGTGTKVNAGSAIGVFSSILTGLPENTLYHVRAYAINAKGTSYGDDKSFTTKITNTGIGDVPANYITGLKVYPNPFSLSTTIDYQIGESGRIRLSIYNVAGNELTILFDGFKAEGSYQIPFSGVQSHLSPGIYFCVLKSDKTFSWHKMVFAR
jgi:hypothetical protein